MNICEPFIRRPIATSLLMLAITVFGLAAYMALPVSRLPNVDFPTIQVTASLPGADPDTMAAAVATPLERQFASISGLDSISSSSKLGSTQVTLQFDLSRNIDAAAQDVQAAINQAARLLPPGMPNPPSVSKVNPAERQVLTLQLAANTFPMSVVAEYGETIVLPRLSMIKGVGQVDSPTGWKYAVRVQLDPSLLAINKIGINEVENALRNWNVNLPTGSLEGKQRNFTLKASGRLMDASAFRSLIVAYRNGSPVRLEEIGNAIDDVEDNKMRHWYFGPEGVYPSSTIFVRKQPGANAVEMRDVVMATLPEIRAQLPPALDLSVLRDDAQTIRASFHDVQLNMLLALILVVMVIFLFLRNASATLIPSLALPFSIIGTFAIMYLLGFSLNYLSLMALILTIGFVVDDAIVMLENIMRHIEKGEKPLQAALTGSKEVGFTIVSMTLSLAAVFIPVLFMGGILGRLFREFSITICAAVLISGIVSLTLTPMLASRFLRVPGEQKQGWFAKGGERIFGRVLRFYDRTLQGVLRHRAATLGVSAAILLVTVFLFLIILKGFMPDEDTNELSGTTEVAQGTPASKMAEYQLAVMQILHKDPNVRSFVSIMNSNSNNGRLVIILKPRSERELGVVQLAQQLRSKLSVVPGIRVVTQIPPAVNIGTQVGQALYVFTLQGSNTEELYRETRGFEQKLAGLPILQDVRTNLQINNPEVHVAIDRDQAAALHLTVQDIENALSDAYGSRWVSTIYASNNQYKVL